MKRAINYHMFWISGLLLAAIVLVSIACGLMFIKPSWCEGSVFCVAMVNILNVMVQSSQMNWLAVLLVVAIVSIIRRGVIEAERLMVMAYDWLRQLMRVRRMIELRLGQEVHQLLLANRLSPKVY